MQPFAQRPAGDGTGQHTGLHLDARFGQSGGSPGRERIRIADGEDHRGDTGGQQCVHAGRRTAGVVARFQGDDRGTSGGAGAGPPQREDLGVRPTRRRGGADAGDLTVTIQDDRSHWRIRIGAALDLFSLLDGRLHGGVEVHTDRCVAAAPACARSARTAAAGSSAL